MLVRSAPASSRKATSSGSWLHQYSSSGITPSLLRSPRALRSGHRAAAGLPERLEAVDAVSSLMDVARALANG